MAWMTGRTVARTTIVFLLLAVAVTATDPVPIVTTFDDVLVGATLVDGLEAIDALGSEVLEIGDIDGDGLADLAFIARDCDEPPYDGRILLGFGSLESKLDLQAWSPWGIEIAGSNRFPCPKASIGDIDGDGLDDVVIPSAFRGPEAGQAVILFGGPALPTAIDADFFIGCRAMWIHPDPGLNPPGTLVALLAFAGGDFDGDGIRDFAVSTRWTPDPDSSARGIVYLVPGVRLAPEVLHLREIGVESGSRIVAGGETDEPTQRAPSVGRKLAAADFDGDGIDDLVLSTPHWAHERDGTVHHAPAVLVLFGREAWPSDLDAADPSQTGICRIVPRVEEGTTRLAEKILEVPGDLTGDGVPDLLVSASLRTEPGCYLISGTSIRPGLLVLEDAAATCFLSVKGADHEIERIADLGDWNGDGRRELAFGIPYRNGRSHGSVVVLPFAGPQPARILLESGLPGSLEILGVEPGSMFGKGLAALDLDGDGRRELVASAPGRTDLGPENQLRGRLLVLHGETDFLGPLEGSDFAPRVSSLRGGGVLRVSGRGFDAGTEVRIGDIPLEVLGRPDSRSLTARIPPGTAAGSFPLRLRRGTAGFELPRPFTYFEGAIPAEVDLNELGASGCTVVNRWPTGDGNCGFAINSRYVRGGHDFSGDGLADVLFAYQRASPDGGECPNRMIFLPGSSTLPESLETDVIEDWAALIESEVPFDFAGWRCDPVAILTGDMTGDGRSEMAIGAATSAAVYIIFGHDLSTGVTSVQELLREGKGCRIEGLPKTPVTPHPEEEEAVMVLIEAGDIDGDGLRDLGINIRYAPLARDGKPVEVGCLALVLGRRDFPPVLDIADVPKVYGKLPLVDEATTSLNTTTDGVGDLDGDGFDDIAISAYSSGDIDEGFFGAFIAWFILFGRPVWQPSAILDEEIESGGACEVVRSYWGRWLADSPGAEIAGIGDEDRDGKDDLGIMTFIPSPAGIDKNFRLLHDRSRSELNFPRDPTKREDFDASFPISPDTFDNISLGKGGRDFNGDGIPEVIIGDRHTTHLPPPSRAIVLFGGGLEDRAGPLNDVQGTLQFLNHDQCPEQVWCCGFPLGFYFGGDINGDRREDIVLSSLGRLWIYFNPLGLIDHARPFRRGDSNSDGAFDLADAVTTLGYLFLGGQEPGCLAAADVDDDDQLEITDPIRLLRWLFLAGEPPAPPRDCGPDPDGSTLDCRESACR
jgi:hypothetical protein